MCERVSLFETANNNLKATNSVLLKQIDVLKAKIGLLESMLADKKSADGSDK